MNSYHYVSFGLTAMAAILSIIYNFQNKKNIEIKQEREDRVIKMRINYFLISIAFLTFIFGMLATNQEEVEDENDKEEILSKTERIEIAIIKNIDGTDFDYK